MEKSVVLLTLHGMGDVDETYYEDLAKGVSKRLGASWDAVVPEYVQYQPILQANQTQYFNDTKGSLSWDFLRKLMIYGFSDAGSLEYSRSTPNGPYFQVQEIVHTALRNAYASAGRKNLPVVIVAQSLGCEVISNYIWDANKPTANTAGIWQTGVEGLDEDEDAFCRLKSLQAMVTTGCNIPVFITGLRADERYPINKPNADFVWDNLYDRDDVLGYPLQPLSQAYKALVRDQEVMVGTLLDGWTPFSHVEYWKDKKVRTIVADHIRRLMT